MQQFEEACKLAQGLYIQGDRPQALEIIKELALKFPDQPMPPYMLSMWLFEDGQDHLAIPVLRAAISIDSKNPEMWCNLGGMFRKTEQREKAVDCYREALKINKEFPAALKGLAGCYVNQGNPAPGIVYARRALKSEGGHTATARNDLGLLLLESGQWEEGFREYQSRAALPIYHVRDYADIPRWEGQKVHTLAIHAEQGLGDEIMFASCLADLAPYAERIVGECNDRLLPLFRRSFPDVTWYGSHEELMGGEVGKINAWERLGDLPRWFRKKPEDCPGTPYLEADRAKFLGYRARLHAMGPGPYTGFAWLGGTAATHRFDRRAPRAEWAKLIKDAPGTKISLQYGEDGARHAAELGIPHWGEIVGDFSDETAALIQALDVIVSSPQTVIHVAGALGKRCLVALSSKPAWRYQLSGPMPWYKSVELFRQRDDGWDPVFFNIGEELAKLGKRAAA